MNFLDKTFCASPNCENECGRKMTLSEQSSLTAMAVLMNPDGKDIIVPVSWGYFCGEPEVKE